MTKVKSEHFSGTLASDKVAGWVVAVIQDGAAATPHINVGAHWVTPRDLMGVADAVRFGDIKVAYHDEHGRDPVYMTTGYIVLRRTVPRGTLTRYSGIVVHEAVHAAFDLQGAKRSFAMSAVDDETAAFLVEALYLRHQGVLASEVADDEYLTAAYHAIGENLGGGRGGPATDRLRHLLHHRYGGKSRRKDGLGR